ncbi:MAG: potassium transporter TrkG [Pseudomonadota bacterium]
MFSDGADTLRRTARPAALALTLACHAPVIAAVFAPPLVWALIENVWPLAIALAAPCFFCIAIWLPIRRYPLPKDLTALEAMMTLAILFLATALLATPAFMALGMPPAFAVFEAISAITTTGLSVARAPDDWPFAGHFLRTWMQWSGGLVMATAVIALLLPSGLPARRLGKAGIDDTDRIASTRAQARHLLGVYVALTCIMAVLTMLVIPGWREPLVLTLSAISTGGFAPRPDSLASYPPLGQALVLTSCVVGAVSLLAFVLAFRGRWRETWALGSLQRLGIALLLVAAATLIFALLTEADPLSAWSNKLANAISALTTAGFSTAAIPSSGGFFIVVLVCMVIGGDVGSTAGGLKLRRIGLMLRMARQTLRQPSLPDHSVAPLRRGGKRVPQEQMVGLVGLAVLYATTAGLLWMHFVFRGYDPAASLFEVLSALSTVGLSVGLVGPDLPADLVLSLSAAMWLGRLEFVAVLVLFMPRNWIRS